MNDRTSSESNIIEVESIFGPIWSFDDDLITKQIVEFGAHTRNELAMVLDHVQPGDTVVDIGAHIGTFSIPIARKCGSNGRVLAIEGDLNTYELLRRNVGKSGLTFNVQCRNYILGESRGPSLVRSEIPKNSGAGFYEPADSGTPSIDACTILAASGYARPNFIKIDVEGMECAVLRSLEPVLSACRPVLYIEVSQKQLERFGDSSEVLESLLSKHRYRYFRNLGQRNSASDEYDMKELQTFRDGGPLFDILALPPIDQS